MSTWPKALEFPDTANILINDWRRFYSVCIIKIQAEKSYNHYFEPHEEVKFVKNTKRASQSFEP